MIQTRNRIRTDNKGKELQEDDRRPFNVHVNDADICRYIGGNIPPHWHKELEIFMLLEGCVDIHIENQSFRLTEGEGCFINSEVLHSFYAGRTSECRFRSFVFGAEIVGGMPGTVFDTEYVRPLMENGVQFLRFQKASDQRYYEQFEKAFSACVTEKKGYEFEVRSALSDILLYIISKGLQKCETIPRIQEQRLKAMLLWTEEHLSETITVPELAKAANICTRECQRIFTQYLHCSPTEHIVRQRIYKAAELLPDTERSITEIALRCGFSSPSYFSQRFRECTGRTPKEYRAAVRTDAKSAAVHRSREAGGIGTGKTQTVF